MIIDFLRGDARIGQRIQQAIDQGHTLATTTVNIAELHRGLQATNAQQRLSNLNDLLTRVETLPLNQLQARRYGQTLAALDAAGKPIPSMDGLIAAITLEAGADLWTNNEDPFTRIAGLRINEPL